MSFKRLCIVSQDSAPRINAGNLGGNQYCTRMERIEKDYKKKEKERAQSSAGNQTGGVSA